MVPRRLSMLFSALVLLAAPASGQEAERFDLIVRGGRVVDGTGNPWIRADVGVRGDRIARVGDLAGAAADRVVDAAGLVVAPGFIDPHTHAVRGIYDVPTADNYLLQGVTTLTEGNDGGSPWPIGAHLEEIAATGISPNWAVFAGQGTIRGEVLGSEDREPTRDELDRMRTLVAEAMEAGALGLSTGLFYVPGSFTPTEEVIALSEVAAAYGGIYISHMRDEAQGLLDSVRETIRIGEEAGLPVQMTHHKAIGRDMWGRSVDSLALVDAARARGVDITIDQYPYTASQTGITAVVPQWAQEGGTSELVVRLEDPETRRRIREEIVYRIEHDRGGGDPANIVIGLCEWDRSLEGKSLADILADRGEAVTVVAAADLVMEIIENGGARAIYHAMDEADVERIMQHPATAIGSDGGVSVFGESVPHPREYGTFARVLGRYVRERGVLTLEEAVRKMSGATAQRIGLRDRGLVREGFFADLAVFDPARIVDRATFEEPHQYAEGVVYVLVNGTLVVDGGEHTGARPGRVLYGPGRPWGSAAPALAQEASGAPPVVWVLATGGTISGGGASSTSLTEYRAGAFSGEQLVAAVPDLARHATIRVEQVANIGSPNITFGDWLTLARRIDDIFRNDPEAAGVVITHGTNTLEETAYFLNLTVRHDRPVVLVGAQRPATAISADGPLNLLNAVRTAAAPEARGKGVLVVMNDEINAARDVTKTSTYRVETFRSRDLGFLGYVDGDRVSFYRAPTKRHTADSEFDLAGVTAFPTVDIVYSYVEPNPVLIETLIAEGVDGIVLAGTGAGLVSRVERAALEEVAALPAAERPVIVRSNRTGSGRVVPLPAYDEQGMIAGDTLNPQKARILLMLALTKTRDLDEIRRIFREY